MNTLRPDEWYVCFTCQGCKAKQVLFPDLSRGKAKINASYIVTCPKCGTKASYDSEQLERYYHPASATHVAA